MAASLLHLKTQLEDLRDELDDGIESLFEKEASQDVADLVQIMADVAVGITAGITNFFNKWDFAEDCRRVREKEAVTAAVR